MSSRGTAIAYPLAGVAFSLTADTVLAEDPVTGRVAPRVVTIVHLNDDPVSGVVVIDGETIQTTPEHPFYTEERGWLPAGELVLGLHVRSATGQAGLVTQVGFAAARQMMYNLTVADDHTYFVGRGAWLVHNCGGPPRNPNGTFAKGGPGETIEAAAGRETHKNYPAALGDDYKYNKQIPGTRFRPDAVDPIRRIVRELKPDAPKAIAAGQRQVARYRRILEADTGLPWTSYVDVYRPWRGR